MEANQLGQPQGFSAMGDRSNFETLRQECRESPELAVVPW